MVGAPHFLSITTLRPFGPSVTFTVFARRSTPRSRAWRASALNSRIFGIAYLIPWIWGRADGQRLAGRPCATRPRAPACLLLDDSEHVAGGKHEVLLARVLHLGTAVLAVQHHVADLDIHGHALGPRIVETAGANRQNLALLGLLLGGVRDHQAGRRGLLRLQRTDYDPVFKRLENNLGSGRHDLTSPSGKAIGELLQRASTAACRRGCQTCLVAFALYLRECQFRTVAAPRGLVKQGRRPGGSAVDGAPRARPAHRPRGMAARAPPAAARQRDEPAGQACLCHTVR